MNAFDLAVLIVLALSGALAFFRGFVHEGLSIAAWIGAIAAALFGLPLVQPFAREQIGVEWIADAAASFAIFLVVLVILSILTRMAAKSIQESALNGLDRTLGFLYGILRGGVIMAAVMISIDWLYEKDNRPAWVGEAKSAPIFDAGADIIRNLLPESFKSAEETAKGTAETVKEAIEAKEMLDRLTQPKAASSPEKDKPEGGYSEKERQRLDQLFESTTDE